MELEEYEVEIPDVLYHATYKPFIDRILEKGLGNTTRKLWSDSKRGRVYLAFDPEVAESYCEENDWLEDRGYPDVYVDNIVVISIDAHKLNPDLFEADQSNLSNFDDYGDLDLENWSTVAYKGIIPKEAFIEIKPAREYRN